MADHSKGPPSPEDGAGRPGRGDHAPDSNFNREHSLPKGNHPEKPSPDSRPASNASPASKTGPGDGAHKHLPGVGAVQAALDRLYPGEWAMQLLPLCAPDGRFATGECKPENFGKAPAARYAKAWSQLPARRRESGVTRQQVLNEVARHVAIGGNVGLIVPEGYQVVDADSADASKHMRDHYPAVPRQRTREGRAHFWFRLPGGVKKLAHGGKSGKKGAKVEVAPGIEVDGRHLGNQLVVAPSVHLSGAVYAWELPLPPSPSDLPELPPELVAAFEKAGAQAAAASGRRRKWDGKEIIKGDRTMTLFRHGCRLRHFGKSQQEIETELLRINREFCKPPLDESDVRKKAASAAKYEPGARHKGTEGEGEKQSDVILRLIDSVDLFHDAESTTYATFVHQGARQTHKLSSVAFRLWLVWRAHTDAGLTPNANAIAEVLSVINSRALFGGPQREVFRRIAWHAGKIYVDLCNEKWEVIEIDPVGWRIVPKPPVRFVRSASAKPLPTPVPGGALSDLRRFLNVANDAGFDLTVGWLVGAFRPKGPYAVLRFFGPQGSAKSTATRVVRALIDPSKVPGAAPPKNEDDLVVAAQHAHVVAFDNVSWIPAWLSDALCRLATGGGVAKRKLYTDDEQACLEACRPVILNGIGSIVERGDAVDRMVDVGLRRLEDGDYRDEETFWKEFDAAAPCILGALFDAVSCALRGKRPSTGTTRMADFTLWVEAAAEALGWKPGEFTRLYIDAREQARQDILSANELATAIVEMAPCQGTATELLKKLRTQNGAETGHRPAWIPKAANLFAKEIDRLVPTLRVAGVEVTRIRATDRKRSKLIRLARMDDAASTSSASPVSASPAAAPQTNSVGKSLAASAPSVQLSPPPGRASGAADDEADENAGPSADDLERLADEEAAGGTPGDQES